MSSGLVFTNANIITDSGVIAGGMLVADSIRNMLGGGAHASAPRDSGTHTEETKYVDDRDNDPGNDPGSYQDDGNDPGFDSGSGGELDI